MFKQLGTDADKFTQRIGLFSKSFFDINKDLKNGLGLRRGLFSIVTDKDIKSLRDYNKAINNGVSHVDAYNTYMSKAPSAIKKQAVELSRLYTQQKQLNKQYNAGKITQQEYNTAMTANKAKIQALTKQTQSLTLAQKAAAVTSKALKTALNMALNVGITLALNGIISLITSFVNSQQEAIEKAKEASETLKEETDTIDEYADKVVELRKKLDEGNLSLEESKNVRVELQQIQDDLIDKYGDEADGIDLVTGSIEDQIEALYNLKKANFENTYQENKQGYDAAVNQIRGKRNFNLDGTNTLAKGFGASYSDEVKELRFFIQRELTKLGFEKVKESNGNIISFHKTSDSDIYTINEDLRSLYDKIEEYSKNGNDTVKKHADDILTYLSGKINETKPSEEIEKMYAQWLQYKSDYSDAYLEIEKKQNQLEQALRSENEKEIAKSREEFLVSYQNALKKAGENGDTDVVNYLEKAFENTISAAEKSSKVIKDITNKTAIPAVSNLVDEYTNLADAIDKVISKQNKLTEIYKKIMTGGSFSRDEVLGYLKEFPDLVDAVMMNGDGTFTFKLDNVKVEMDKSNDDLTNQIQAKVDEATKGVNVSIEDYFKSNEDYQNAFSMASSGFRSNADVSAFKEKYFAEHKGEYDKYIQDQEKALNGLSNVLGIVDDNLISQAENVEILDERYNNAVDNITQYNSSLDTLQEAISAVNAGQGLNYEQMTKLLEIDPSLSSSITERNGLYYVEIQALNDLKKARQEEQKEAIRLEKKETEVLIVQTQQRVEAIGREMAASFAKRDELMGDYTLYSQLLEGYKKILDGLDEYEYDPMQNSGSGSSGTSGISDILQQQIDRYEVLLNAIEIVANKRIELLEAEKEALQDKNDEEQRELDLIEAKNNLDKAKKMKAIVYEKGKGFVQVENKKAISDARKEYDDAVLEKRTAEIDKQIEGLENYAKPFTEMKSDIEDAITVEQAKKALKTDEKGLLSLDEKTAKNIRDGLADAVLKKDKQDNKDNPYYQPLPLDDLLKSLGATVTGEQAKVILSDSLNNMKFPQTNMQAFNSSTTNNSYVNNTSSSNRNVSLNSTFNIYDASDPEKVRSEIDKYFRDIAREIK